jgi:hypothetical protein
VILHNECKRSTPFDLTEERIKGCYSVCAEKEDRKPAGTMPIIQVIISLQHLEETEWSVSDPTVLPIMLCHSAQLIGTDVRAPSVRNQMLLLQSDSLQRSVTTEWPIINRPFQTLLQDPVVRIHEAMRGMCGAEELDWLTVRT